MEIRGIHKLGQRSRVNADERYKDGYLVDTWMGSLGMHLILLAKMSSIDVISKIMLNTWIYVSSRYNLFIKPVSIIY